MNRQPDMRQLLQQAQRMQEQLAKTQESLASQEFEGTAGGGLVTAVVTGSHELVSLSISPEAVDPSDIELLEDLVVAAVRNASEAASNAVTDQIGGLTGGMDLGGLLG